MNSVNVVGRLTRDPELKHIQSGTALCKIRIAVDRAGDMDGDDPKAGFFNVTFWKRTAEVVAEHFVKGKQIAVTGSLRHHTWEADDGTNREQVEINAFGFTFVGSKSDGEGGDFSSPATDDNIPF